MLTNISYHYPKHEQAKHKGMDENGMKQIVKTFQLCSSQTLAVRSTFARGHIFFQVPIADVGFMAGNLYVNQNYPN